jgi:putative FmdB family regulatory protein
VPTYEYRCDTCAKDFDVVQSFHEDPLTECPTCGSPVRKVFGSVGIVFKGSGFYKTDSRSGSGAKVATAAKEGVGSAAPGAQGDGPSGSPVPPPAASPSSSSGNGTGSTTSSPTSSTPSSSSAPSD